MDTSKQLELQPFRPAWPRQLVPHALEIYGAGPLPSKQQVWVRSLAYGPDGEHIFVGTYYGLAFDYNSQTGQRVGVLRDAHSLSLSNAVRAIALSPNGERVLTGDDEGQTLIVRSAKAPYAPEARLLHESGVVYAGFVGDGTRFVTGTSGGMIRVWNATNHTLDRDPIRCCVGPVVHGPFPIATQVYGLAFDPKDSTVITVSAVIRKQRKSQVVRQNPDSGSEVWDIQSN